MTTLTTPHVLKQKEIEKALCGEKILLNQLLQSMRKRVLAVLQKNGVSLNDTEDCVQHALIKFWEHKNDIHPENNVIFSWLCTTALNKARDIQRK